MSGQLEGKAILISGATGGLGEPVVRAFLDAGAHVAGTARKWPAPPAGTFEAITADLTTEEGCADAVDRTLARFGRLDAVIHLMGGFAMDGPVESTKVETWDAMTNLNLRSAFLLFRAAIPRLNKPGGHLIAIGSQAAIDLPAGVSAYAVSKAGVHALMRVLAAEGLKGGFTANVIAPGTIDTPANRAAMPDADRTHWVKPEDVAAELIRICSGELEMKAPKLTEEQIAAALASLPQWTVASEKLHREYKFGDFVQAFSFMTAIALVAERMDHHPEWLNVWNRVTVDLSTHDSGGITEKDVALAAAMEAAAARLS